VDLWSDVQVNPSELVHRAIRKALAELQSPLSAILKKLQKVTNAEMATHGFKFSPSTSWVNWAGRCWRRRLPKWSTKLTPTSC
jgi:hypothetical protein